jgi:superfamily II DNA or RNA helicase
LSRNVAAAAAWIVNFASSNERSAADYLDRLIERHDWEDCRERRSHQDSNGVFREAQRRTVALGLGIFDLVVIDEAHKSRHADTGLAKLIERAMWTNSEHRRLALTATPVELNAEQWQDILHRIQAPTDGIDSAIENYATAVRKVRLMPSSDEARSVYNDAARRFQGALRPYLLRRDKREDEAVRRFVDGSGLSHDAYRRESEIVVDPLGPGVDSEWRRAICAAEALSHIDGEASDGRSKRARLTVGSGHGIAALLEEPMRDENEDPALDDDETESDAEAPAMAPEEPASATRKRAERHDWWSSVIRRLASSGDQALYDHPAIRAAVDAIESSTRVGEKVLVFGRYTRPLRALVRLLNAREMWRALDRGDHWPQSQLDDAEWSAAEAAQRQLDREQPMSREQLAVRLADNYRVRENARDRFRRHLIEGLETGFESLFDNYSVERALLDALRHRDQPGAHQGADSDLAMVARALHALGVESLETDGDRERAAKAFIDLVGALRARNEGDENNDGEIDADEAAKLWQTLSERLQSEYARSEGDHARLLYGGTKPATRRLLQLAFNRSQSNPKVLVAQSMVGREGLNLHLACRTVVLLHPEWNPGVVEQQIGRVDRIGSRWQQLCDERNGGPACGADWPRIEVRPVIFKGTYDEQNWAVLRERWRDLRAQLHGIVLPEWEVPSELREIARDINAAAPHFSPTVTRDSLKEAGTVGTLANPPTTP